VLLRRLSPGCFPSPCRAGGGGLFTATCGQTFESFGEGSIGEFLTEDVRATVSGDEREPRREIALGA
jgi:hypothetical protein